MKFHPDRRLQLQGHRQDLWAQNFLALQFDRVPPACAVHLRLLFHLWWQKKRLRFKAIDFEMVVAPKLQESQPEAMAQEVGELMPATGLR